MPFLSVGQWRALLVAGCALLLVAGWRFAHGSGGPPAVLDPAVARGQPAALEGCPESRGTGPGDEQAAPVGGAEGIPDGARAMAELPGEGRLRPPQGAGAEAAALEPEGAPGVGLVDVNRADAAALQQLPGIGPVLATRIVEYRERWGPFSHPEDLLEVSGIGPRLLARIRDRIVIGEP